MRRLVATVVLLVVVVPLAAGCGGAGDASAGGPPAPNVVVMEKSYRFDPGEIRVEPGTSVTFRNDDNFTHTVQVEDGRVHEVEPGEFVAIPFPQEGRFHYVCTLHETEMEGDVVVG